MKTYNFEKEIAIINTLIEKNYWVLLTKSTKKPNRKLYILFEAKDSNAKEYPWNILIFEYNKKLRRELSLCEWGYVDYYLFFHSSALSKNPQDFIESLENKFKPIIQEKDINLKKSLRQNCISFIDFPLDKRTLIKNLRVIRFL